MPIDPLIAQGVIATAQAISRGGPRRQYKWNKRAAEDTNRMNRDNAVWALEENKKIQHEQRVYDSPEAQMARYKKAGLNPHLIYGSGSSAGSAFPISTQGIAPSRIDSPNASYPDLAGSFIQAGQSIAQTELIGAKTIESEQKSELLGLQRAIAATNPMLDPRVYKATVESLESVAELKMREAQYMKSGWHEYGTNNASRNYAAKIDAEIEALFKKLDLNTQDLAVKNKILESKEFENAIKQVQAEWLKDGDISPEHIRQGIMLLLTKMLGR